METEVVSSSLVFTFMDLLGKHFLSSITSASFLAGSYQDMITAFPLQ